MTRENRYDPDTQTLYEVRTDECPESPRTDFSVWGFVFFHRRYDLANELQLNYKDFSGWEAMEAHIREQFTECEIHPISMYDHGNVAFLRGKTGDWDSGQGGFAWRCPTDEPLTPEEALKALDEELEEYTNYINGEVRELVVTRGDDAPEYSSFYTWEALKAYLDKVETGYAKALPLKKTDGLSSVWSRASSFIEEKGLVPEYLKWLTE